MERMAAGGRTSLWWDTVNCRLPSPSNPYVINAMSSALLRRFGIINVHAKGGGGNLYDHLSAYQLFSETQTQFDQILINAGIRMQQTAPGDFDVEKMMMADVLLWAMDTPPPANIVLIVGYMDFSYVFEKLRQRSYNVFLVSSSNLLVPEFSLMLEETHSRSIFYYGLESSFRVPFFRIGWNNPSPNETGRNSVQPDPGFNGHYITAEKYVRPLLLPSSTEDNERPTFLPPNKETEYWKKVAAVTASHNGAMNGKIADRSI